MFGLAIDEWDHYLFFIAGDSIDSSYKFGVQ